MKQSIESRIAKLEARTEAIAAVPDPAIRERLLEKLVRMPYVPSSEPVDVDGVVAAIRARLLAGARRNTEAHRVKPLSTAVTGKRINVN